MEEDSPEGGMNVPDPDTYNFNQEDGFSHPAQVSLAYIKCINSGCQEMKRGYWESKVDKFGNANKYYVGDTRKQFIESVETLIGVVISNFDEEAKKKIQEELEELDKISNDLKNKEHMWYISLSPSLKREVTHINGYFNQDLIFYHNYIDEKLKCYRNIFKEIEQLLSRTKYLKRKPTMLSSKPKNEDARESKYEIL